MIRHGHEIERPGALGRNVAFADDALLLRDLLFRHHDGFAASEFIRLIGRDSRAEGVGVERKRRMKMKFSKKCTTLARRNIGRVVRVRWRGRFGGEANLSATHGNNRGQQEIAEAHGYSPSFYLLGYPFRPVL